MRAWIIVTGDEILNGKTLDYNSYWVAKRLTSMGIEVKRRITVPDDKKAIKQSIQAGIPTADLIILIGGLGPTPRDETLIAIAEALEKELVLNDTAVRLVKDSYKRFYQQGFVDSPKLNDARRKMAQLPEGSKPLENAVGGAPGVFIRHKNTQIFSLPGVPSELMYTLEQAIPILFEAVKGEEIVRTREVFIEAQDESAIAGALEKVMQEVKDTTIKSYPTGFGKKMRIIAVAHAQNSTQAEEKLEKAISLLRKQVFS